MSTSDERHDHDVLGDFDPIECAVCEQITQHWDIAGDDGGMCSECYGEREREEEERWEREQLETEQLARSGTAIAATAVEHSYVRKRWHACTGFVILEYARADYRSEPPLSFARAIEGSSVDAVLREARHIGYAEHAKRVTVHVMWARRRTCDCIVYGLNGSGKWEERWRDNRSYTVEGLAKMIIRHNEAVNATRTQTQTGTEGIR